MEVRVPRLNANEDSVQLTYLPIQSGDVVTKGQEIASVQSTKAAVSIESPCDGKIGRIYVGVNEYVNVDSVLCDVIVPVGNFVGGEAPRCLLHYSLCC